jgi:hypothetical protein
MEFSSTQPDTPGSRSQAVGIDLDPARRPGVPKERAPSPWPNTRFPPERMRSRSSVPKHGRPGKPMPPVYATAVPLRGLSGAIRQAAYGYPDHHMRHWTMLLFADRVDSWETRARRLLPVAVPLAAIGWVGARILGLVGGDRRGVRGLRRRFFG